MSMPMMPPSPKNPVLRTPQFNPPPAVRGRVALGMTAAAARGEFALQVCSHCSAVQYPPREACVQCSSADLRWQRQSGKGQLLATTTLTHSNDLYFRERLPWRLGMVQLDAGPSAMVHLHHDVPAPQTGEPLPRVCVTARLDRTGQAVLFALPEKAHAHMQDDPMLREMASDPKFRKILVTDGTSPLGQAVVKAMLKAGAAHVWVGHAEPWKEQPGFASLAHMEQVTLVPLDVTDERSVRELAARIGGKVDILVNTAEFHRCHGISSRRGTDIARAEMEVNYLGLLRLAQNFGPALQGRSADGVAHATAWVNVLSIFALSNFPAQGTFSASKAAALSLAQCLRAEMRMAGIRVVNLFPGPLDDDWNQNLPPPKVAPQALAKAIVEALCNGVEDVYPGDIAQDWLARWRDDPKVLERELAAGGM